VFEPRQCVLIGTTNQECYLRDPTGGRRFWPVKVVSIARRDQLWAEAVHHYRKGAKWWPDGEFERAQIQAQQEARFDEDAWTDVIREHLHGVPRTTVMRVAVALGFTNDRLGTRDQRRISGILRRLDWVQERDEAGRWWAPKPACA
jgi:predicted P-loop ATPase